MATDLTTTDPADGRRALAWKALNLLTSTTERAIVELGDQALPAIDAAIEKTEHELRPVPTGDGRAEWEAALDERMRRLAVKVAPTASEAQTAPWRDAMKEALSDLPAMVALSAARRAIHRPFRFIGDIEHGVREIADEIIGRRRARLVALRRMRREIERAAAPAIALPECEEREYTAAQIRAMSADIRSIGLKVGALTQAQIDAALRSDCVLDEEVKVA